MRKSLVFLMAVSVCLALAFTPLMADRNDRTADRTKASQRGATSDDTVSIHPAVRAKQLQWRHAEDLSTANRAAGHVAAAANLEGDAAVSELMAAINMGVADEKLLSEAYTRLGDLYDGTAAKQVHFYALAMQYTAEPEARAQLQSRIVSLGGDVLALSVRPSNNVSSSMNRGPGDDTCDVSVPITLPWFENMSIDFGDHNWRSFDIPGPELWAIKIETISPNPPFVDDTDLTLWADCIGGVPQGALAFNDDGGEGFMSLIDTDCLPPGTYYIEVGGWFDISVVPDFDLTVEVTEICIPAAPDGFEPDDERRDATPIGKPTSLPDHANGWGRAKDEIQAHSIAPPLDLDNVKFAVTPGAERVDMRLAQVFPTKWNDFEAVPGGTDFDSFMELLYGNEPNYGGMCNTPDEGFSIWCFTDADCEGIVYNPLPSFPDCVPMQYFTVGGAPYWFWENPLAYNDDGGEGFASALDLCLPRGDHQTTSGTASGDWLLRVWPYSATSFFDYQVMVKNQAACAFEVEPNDDFVLATPLTLGVPMSGIVDQSNYGPNGADPDLYSFDVGPDGANVLFETIGYDYYEVDTALELYVGPDDYGYYYDTGISNDDCYVWLSCLDIIMPQADDLLGNMYADANYLLNVTTWYLNKNFPYTLLSAELAIPNMEAEPNDTCATANDVEAGGVIQGALDDYYVTGICDYDSFHLTVTADTLVSFETDGAIDTTVALYDSAGTWLGCDDDGGYSLGSLLSGCLPADDYCLQVRGYGYWTVGTYDLMVTDGGTCSPTTPVWLGEAGLRCDGGEAEFSVCPN